MKKVLIWDKDLKLKDVGGPSGYLYNLKLYLDKYPNKQITFYSDIFSKKTESSSKPKGKGIISRVKSTPIGKVIAYLGWFYYQQSPLTEQDLDILNRYDFVHIHLLSTYLRSFRDYSGHAKVIITSHMPEPCIDETMGLCGYPNLLKKIPFLRDFFIRMEIAAYEHAYRIMFPVEDAIEVYTKNSKLYKKAFQRLRDKIFYVPTAIVDKEISSQKSSILSSKNIPENNLRLCFIGRHNQVKGYDMLKIIAQECWKKYPDTTFIIGGKEAPLMGLSDKRWLELGWINTQELLKEIDVFVLPNKDTYFDLILLEVLRQGVPCMISRTGGNKYFENAGIDGIRLYDYIDVNDAVKQIEIFREYKASGKFELIKQEIRSFYLENFIPEVYVKNYINQIDSL